MTPGAGLDGIDLEVLGNLLLAIAEEMGVGLVRTAFSPNIKERADCSAAIFDGRGELLAQAAHIPMHLSSLLDLPREILARFPGRALGPGDLFVANDPYAGGGSHLNDIAMALPVFAGDRLLAFVANIAHHADVGGRVPGSETADSRTIFEEGLRIPVVKLAPGGTLQRDLWDLVLLNSRTPREREGDLRAQMAACRQGARRLGELIDRRGEGFFRAGAEGLLGTAERRARGALSRLPPGTYVAEDLVDDGETAGQAGRICVRLEIRNGHLRADFAGTSPQLPWGKNVPRSALLAAVYYAVKAVVDPGLPPNGGWFRAVTVEAPPASLVQAAPPAGVAARFVTCQKVADVVLAALAQAAPDRGIGGCHGGTMLLLAGRDPRRGETFVDYEVYAGGHGARMTGDGLSARQAHLTNTSNLPVEALEAEYPLLVERYELIPDSGGPGKFRGGLAVRRAVRVLADGAEASGWSCNQVRPPRGILGGRPGRPGGFFGRAPAAERPLGRATLAPVALRRGDVLRVETAGGGGWGAPRDRDPALLREDLAEGYVTGEGAGRDYGIDNGVGKPVDSACAIGDGP